MNKDKNVKNVIVPQDADTIQTGTGFLHAITIKDNTADTIVVYDNRLRTTSTMEHTHQFEVIDHDKNNYPLSQCECGETLHEWNGPTAELLDNLTDERPAVFEMEELRRAKEETERTRLEDAAHDVSNSEQDW